MNPVSAPGSSANPPDFQRLERVVAFPSYLLILSRAQDAKEGHRFANLANPDLYTEFNHPQPKHTTSRRVDIGEPSLALSIRFEKTSTS
jgi:hypothetical protein